MKNVSLIHGGWLNAPNGASTVLNSLYNNKELFSAEGINLSFYTMDDIAPNKFADNQNYKGKSKLKSLIINLAKNYSLFSWITIWGYYLRHAKAIVNYYNKKNSYQVDYVFIHDIFTCYYYIKFSRIKKPIVFVLHSNGDTFKMLRCYYKNIEHSCFYKKLQKVESVVLKNITKLIFVAQKPAETFIRLHPDFPVKKISVIYNGIRKINHQLELKGRNCDDLIRFCCVGTLSERKGQRLLIESLKILKSKGINHFKLTFVGDGDIREELEKLVNTYDLQDDIIFVGRSNEVDKILASQDLYVLISEDEGFPISILEAMRIGLPIISTNVGGVPEMVISNYNGMIIEGDIHTFVKVLESIDKKTLFEWGKNSYELFNKKFTINNMIINYCREFNNL